MIDIRKQRFHFLPAAGNLGRQVSVPVDHVFSMFVAGINFLAYYSAYMTGSGKRAYGWCMFCLETLNLLLYCIRTHGMT
jgi:hypothetical protein